MWLYDRRVELPFILLPPLLAVAVALWVHLAGLQGDTPVWAWLILVLGIDVAHVYSTIYRTYLVPGALATHRTLLLGLPLFAWVAGVLLYAWDAHWFWRVLAYTAVFHFVRQQYGLMRLYGLRQPLPTWRRRLDAVCIYLATLYPLLYWHAYPRSFHWFVADDFVRLPLAGLLPLVGIVYLGCLAAYTVLAIQDARSGGAVPWPKHVILLGTAAAWYVGIVWLDGDLTFTLTNVVAHGIPYMALVWLKARAEQQPRSRQQGFPVWLRYAGLFVMLIIGLAYAEEALWDGLVWRERGSLYAWLPTLPDLSDSPLLVWIVPTLALPQATHYLLDAYIWRRGFHPHPPPTPPHDDIPTAASSGAATTSHAPRNPLPAGPVGM